MLLVSVQFMMLLEPCMIVLNNKLFGYSYGIVKQNIKGWH